MSERGGQFPSRGGCRVALSGLERFLRPVTLPVPPCPRIQAISAIPALMALREGRPGAEGRAREGPALNGFLIPYLQGTAWAPRRGLGQGFRRGGVLRPPPAPDHSACPSVSEAAPRGQHAGEAGKGGMPF